MDVEDEILTCSLLLGKILPAIPNGVQIDPDPGTSWRIGLLLRTQPLRSVDPEMARIISAVCIRPFNLYGRAVECVHTAFHGTIRMERLV